MCPTLSFPEFMRTHENEFDFNFLSAADWSAGYQRYCSLTDGDESGRLASGYAFAVSHRMEREQRELTEADSTVEARLRNMGLALPKDWVKRLMYEESQLCETLNRRASQSVKSASMVGEDADSRFWFAYHYAMHCRLHPSNEPVCLPPRRPERGDWLCPQLTLKYGRFTMLIAPSSAGKSSLVREWCVMASLGGQHGPLTFHSRRKKILYLHGEESDERIWEDLHAFGIARGVDARAGIVTHNCGSMDLETYARTLDRYARDVDLVVIDTMPASFGVDTNDKAIGDFVSLSQRHGAAYNVAFIAPTHPNREQAEQAETTKTTAKNASGNYQQRGRVDYILSMVSTFDSGGNILSIDLTGNKNRERYENENGEWVSVRPNLKIINHNDPHPEHIEAAKSLAQSTGMHGWWRHFEYLDAGTPKSFTEEELERIRKLIVIAEIQKAEEKALSKSGFLALYNEQNPSDAFAKDPWSALLKTLVEKKALAIITKEEAKELGLSVPNKGDEFYVAGPSSVEWGDV